MQIGGGKYYLADVIAAGSYGKVYASYPYAVKELQLPPTGKSPDSHRKADKLKKVLTNEIQILTELNHPNVVKLYEVIYEKDFIYLVMEYCQSDLRMLRKETAFGEKKATEIMRQVVAGCKQMVRVGVVHRDLKPANILMNNNVYKIADFGMALCMEIGEERLLQSHVGTPYYMAPQILQRQDYNRKCDVWSLGVIYFEMIFGKLPWEGRNETALLNNILTHPLKYPHSIAAQTKEILERMLVVPEHARVGWDQLFKLFELQEKRDTTLSSQTFHRSLLLKIISIERERLSRMECKCPFQKLSSEERRKINRNLQHLFRDEEVGLLRQFTI